MKCKITCTPGTHAAWFTVEETAWLETFLPEITDLTEQSGKGTGKARSALYDRIREEFTKKFPYRDPEANPQYEYTPEQRALAMKATDRDQLRGRIRSKVSLASRNKHAEGTAGKSRSRPARGPGSSKSVGDNVPSPPPTVHEDDGDDPHPFVDTPKDKSTEGSSWCAHGGGDRADLEQILKALGPRYQTSSADKEQMKWVLKTLGDMIEESWAEIDERTLRERQGQLLLLSNHLIKLLQHALGAEVVLHAVYHDGKKIQVNSASSSRMTDYEDSSRAETSRKSVFRFAERKIGE
ncbi:hypothetical protein FS749_003857 [Ceratobasidium sp. UAMH 11750]|nr:hypothetical protein FS749_003857 [Ceratobasidium sp. UAMH 11750]